MFSLDSGRWPGLSAQVGALVVQDLKAVCGEALHGPRGPWYVMIDEFSALDGPQLLGLLARGAAAGCSVILATQELADLNAAGDGFRDQVLGNAALKAAFRQDVPDSAELWAAMAGTQPGWAETIQTAHRSAGPVATATGHATGTGIVAAGGAVPGPPQHHQDPPPRAVPVDPQTPGLLRPGPRHRHPRRLPEQRSGGMRSRPLLIAGRVALWAAVILVFGRGLVSLVHRAGRSGRRSAYPDRQPWWGRGTPRSPPRRSPPASPPTT